MDIIATNAQKNEKNKENKDNKENKENNDKIKNMEIFLDNIYMLYGIYN